MLYFRILGPIEASGATGDAALGPPKQRALLAILLIHLGEIVSTDRLIDLLWGDRPPRTAAHSVQIYVSELRKALEPLGGGELIVTRQPGYQLHANPESVDAHAFEALVEKGAALIQAGESDAGVSALREAMRLWRGPALTDFAYEEFAQPHIRRLTDLHLDAIEYLAAAELDAGRTTDVLSMLEAAIREDPLRERSRELLMLALYRAGRHAEALRTFQRFREMLADELGLDPSPALVRLQERILLHDPSLTPAAQAVAESLHDRNPYKGLKAFGEGDAPDFFGRDALVERLLAALGDGSRLVSLVGPSGSGKSSAIAAGLIPRLRAGAIQGSDGWEIATIVPGTGVIADLDSVVERATQEPDGGTRVAGDRRTLVVIDQFEELFNAPDEALRRRFLDVLIRLVSDADGNVSAVLSLRADFYDRPLLDADFAAIFIPSVLNVVPMTANEIEAAVVKPAERVGVTVESALMAELVAESADRPGGLPMLQYALTELFDQQTDRVLTLAGYRALGGLKGILSGRAESVYLELAPEEQRVTMQVFLRLVRLGQGTIDSRRRIPLSDLADLDLDPVALSRVLETFRRHRFLSFDRDPVTSRATVEVAHEALFREWDRLAGWIDRHRSALRRHATFEAAVEEWELSGRDDDYLLSGTRLAEFESWSHEGVLQLTGREREFLQAGLERSRAHLDQQAARERQQRALERKARRGVIALVAAISLFVAAVLVAIVGLQTGSGPQVALLHYTAGGVDAQFFRAFDRGVKDFGLVGNDRLWTSDNGQADLRALSEEGNRLIMVFSFDSELFNEVVREYPDSRYVLLDQEGSEPNVTYVLFDDHESAFLGGAAAALKTNTGTIGFVGGMDIEQIWRFQAGFEAGARSVNPDIEVLTDYLAVWPQFDDGFLNPPAGKEAALAMYRQGADIVFHAAGPSGTGVFEAATEESEATGKHLWAIGADTDQYETVGDLPQVVDTAQWRPHILTSVLKRFDSAIYDALSDFAAGSLQPGIRRPNLESGGVDISYSGGFIDDIRPRLDELKAEIIAGQIGVPCVPADKADEAAAQGSQPSCRR